MAAATFNEGSAERRAADKAASFHFDMMERHLAAVVQYAPTLQILGGVLARPMVREEYNVIHSAVCAWVSNRRFDTRMDVATLVEIANAPGSRLSMAPGCLRMAAALLGNQTCEDYNAEVLEFVHACCGTVDLPPENPDVMMLMEAAKLWLKRRHRDEPPAVFHTSATPPHFNLAATLVLYLFIWNWH